LPRASGGVQAVRLQDRALERHRRLDRNARPDHRRPRCPHGASVIGGGARVATPLPSTPLVDDREHEHPARDGHLLHDLRRVRDWPDAAQLPSGGRLHEGAVPGQPGRRGARRGGDLGRPDAAVRPLDEPVGDDLRAPPTAAGADYRVRIFTPVAELPFAGHPTLGTCHAWLEAGGAPRSDAEIVQECAAGLVSIRRTPDGLGFAAPPLTRSGPVDDEELTHVARTLNIDRGAIVAAEWADNGPGWVALLLESADAVLAVRPGLVDHDV